MSPLFEHINQLYTKGHNGEPPALFGDQRLEGIEQFTPAAVLAAITERDGEPGVLLLHRPDRKSVV